MDTKLSAQLQDTLDVLALAQTKARQTSQTMKKQRVSFGLEYGHMEDDIAHIIGKMRYMLRLAQRKEQIDAQTANHQPTDNGTATE